MFDMLSVFAFTVRGDEACRRIPLLDRVPPFVLHSLPLVLDIFLSVHPVPFVPRFKVVPHVREEMAVGVHPRRITARRITILFYWFVGGGETTSVAAASL